MDNIDTLKSLLYESERKYRNNTAFYLKDSGGAIYEVTYEKFKSDCDCLGTALIYELGAKGKNVAVFMANCYEWCVSYLAVTGGVGTVVPLDKELPCNELYNIIEFHSYKHLKTLNLEILNEPPKFNYRFYLIKSIFVRICHGQMQQKDGKPSFYMF